MALNPYFLEVTDDSVKLYHPSIEFAPVNVARRYTWVPVGKFRLKIYDNLISFVAKDLGGKSFEAYSQWSR